MKIIPQYKTTGDVVNLKISRKNHIADKTSFQSKSDSVSGDFSNLFNKALNNVNQLELNSNALTSQMAINPDSVDIHDVQIAAEKAEMAVLFTKGIVDRVIRAYKEITSLR